MNTRSVLIVTRERLLGDLLCEVLRGHRYACVVETQPTLAQKRFVAEVPLLTIIDLASLGYEGLEIIADVRRTDASAVIIAIIGLGTSTLESTAHSLGVADVMHRDDDISQVLELVSDLDREKGSDKESVRTGMRNVYDRGKAASRPILDEPMTVLVVDDDPGVRKLLHRVLTRDGYDVLTASDGVEALECLDREDVRLMFLDLRLPRLGGVAVLRRLRERGSQPRTVVMSGLADHELMQEVIKLGAFDYLQKPLSVDRVLVTASTAIVLDRARRPSFWDKWKKRAM